MKRCPECKRDYYDDTLLYCLDDGAHLLEGPANATRPTEVLPSSEIPGEATTAILPTVTGRTTLGGGRSIKPFHLLLIAFAALFIAAAGFIASRSYFRPNTQISSIAVLPFVNASGNAELDYLSDGVSASVIDRLSQLPQLKVIARSSSFKYRGPDPDLQKIAGDLGVQAIVTGQVTQRGDELSIRVELIDSQENKQLWGKQYLRKIKDADVVEQEIAQNVTENLRLNLSGAQETQLAKRQAVNPDAYELLLKGKYYFDQGGIDNRRKATGLFEQAVAADPNYAPAYANLSACYRRLAADSVVDPKEFIPKAEAAARKALELDDGLADAHLTMGNLYQYTWKWADAEREYKRGLELNPNLGIGHRAYSLYLSLVGKHDEAMAEALRARELDPVVTMANASVGYRDIFARHFDSAIAELQTTSELDPTFDFTQVLLGYAYAGKGDYPHAITAYQEAVRLGDSTPSTQIYLGAAYAKSGDKAKGAAILEQLKHGKDYVSPGELAILYEALGDDESAFESLEKGFAAHDLQLQFLKADPAFDGLRGDPRFADLLRRVGLSQ